MNLDELTSGQRACVTTLCKPLVVSAGAGSGKTHTLTQRIVWALTPGSAPSDEAFLSGVDEVLAITFTEKAARELKMRVREALVSAGLKTQALLVDEAWISTIHGMCSRMLRAHAVEAGVASRFEVIGDLQAEALRREAVEEVLSSHADVLRGSFTLLFAEYGASSRGRFAQGSLPDMIDFLVKEAAAHPEGVGCFVLPPEPSGQSVLLEDAIALMGGLALAVETQGQSQKRNLWLAAYQDFQDEVCRAHEAGLTLDAVLRCFARMPLPNAGFGSDSYKEQVKKAKVACGRMLQEAKALVCRPHLEALLRVARLACEAYEKKKRARGVLTQDDLLVKTAMLFRSHPEVAARYEEAFKLVMVDEFQDTDRLQLEIIGRLAGPNAERLCVVGDLQQSIYRFRGADPSVFQEHRDSLRSRSPQDVIELADNFRSHGDILRFADRVFGHKRAFSEYMPLRAARIERREFALPLKRVRVLQTDYSPKGFGASNARQAEAARIADAFAECREAGCKDSDLVLLLGRMSNADTYAQALRSRGFSCVITGGSVFSKAPEVRAMACLAKTIANPRSERDLYRLLASDVFRLSSADLLWLVTQGGARRKPGQRAGLEAGLRWVIATGGETCPSARLRCAARVLFDACYGSKGKSLSELMAGVVARSGWMVRLRSQGPEGQAAAANVLKCIRLAEDFQREEPGLASAARRFAAYAEAAKEAPGVLSVQEGGFVRIMSVHASKGLEFPVVAVAEMQSRGDRASCLTCERVQGAVRVSLEPGVSVRPYKGSGLFGLRNTANTARVSQDIGDPLAQYSLEQDFKERVRLLYVALTRAKEAVVLSMRTAGAGRRCGSVKGEELFDVVREGLFGETDIPLGQTLLDFGGEAPALISRMNAEELLDAGSSSGFGLPPGDDQEIADWEPGAPAGMGQRALTREGQGFASYSSLQAGLRLAEYGEAAGLSEGQDPFWANLTEDLRLARRSATDLGTVFHLLARRCVLREEGACIIRMPDQDAIRAVALRHGLDDARQARLVWALRRWVRSAAARRVESLSCVRPELPFCVSVPSCPGLLLEGSMDLFASDCEPCASEPGCAYVVDYKTGGVPGESDQALRDKHRLQAQCYAYAALRRGFAEVCIDFVYVEQPDGRGADSSRSVRFEFKKEDADDLAEAIRHAYEKAGKRC